jgi:hypothetical protein
LTRSDRALSALAHAAAEFRWQALSPSVPVDLFRVRSPSRADPHASSQLTLPAVLSESSHDNSRSTTSSGTWRARLTSFFGQCSPVYANARARLVDQVVVRSCRIVSATDKFFLRSDTVPERGACTLVAVPLPPSRLQELSWVQGEAQPGGSLVRAVVAGLHDRGRVHRQRRADSSFGNDDLAIQPDIEVFSATSREPLVLE